MTRDQYRLSPRSDGAPYTLEQVVALCDHAVSNGYHQSYRLALAIKGLQVEVEKAVRAKEPETSARLFPADDREATRICYQAGFDKELRFDPTREMARVEKGAPSWRTPLIRAAQDDPLRMARKHVVDLLDEMNHPEFLSFDLSGAEKAAYRQNNVASVQQLMILLADNAANHQEQGRAV